MVWCTVHRGTVRTSFPAAFACLALACCSGAEALRLPVTRDTWFSKAGKEADCNLGGSDKLKTKSIVEMSLVDIDPAPLRGRVVERAALHFRVRGQERQRRMTVSGIGSEWVEGTSPRYAPQEGSSCFNWRRYPDVPWAHPGSDLTAVVLGSGGTVWGSAEATAPDERGWQSVAVSPRVVMARTAGVSHGFLLFDDTGSEWTRSGPDGEVWTQRLFPNRFLHSRHSRGSEPWMEVELGAADERAPAAVEARTLSATTEGLGAGEIAVRWNTPADEGAGVIGFRAELDGRAVPRHLIPAAGKAGDAVEMLLRDIEPGRRLRLWAVDGAGNESAAVDLELPPPLALPEIEDNRFSPFLYSRGVGWDARLGDTVVHAGDLLDKVSWEGGMIKPHLGHSESNHRWGAHGRTVWLRALRGEFVCFNVFFAEPVEDLAIRTEDLPGPRWYEVVPVPTAVGPVGDPLLERADGRFAGPVRQVLCEMLVPKDAGGVVTGTVSLARGGDTLDLKVVLRVVPASMPDRLGFLPEMNCYSLPENERDYYRLAHEHRTVLNRVPYSHAGTIDAGCAPEWKGEGRFDWTAWDRRYGSLFDGSLFADLPRGPQPVEVFYLPLHENWPMPMAGNYNGGYWADEAFSPEYRAGFVAASQAFAEHLDARGWHRTLFEFYLNNKNMYKKRGWSRATSPWLLDEPANWQDYWALRWFGLAFHEGIDQVPDRRTRLAFRCDISRPEWQREVFDGLLDVNIVGGGAFARYNRRVIDRKRRNGELVIPYGSANAVKDSNVQPAAWCWWSWCHGGDGVLPWQTIGREDSWKKDDRLSLFYPGGAVGRRAPVPSIRLKAFRRGQQDAELLAMARRALGVTRAQMGQAVWAAMEAEARRVNTGFQGGEDAGEIRFDRLASENLHRIREGLLDIVARQ